MSRSIGLHKGEEAMADKDYRIYEDVKDMGEDEIEKIAFRNFHRIVKDVVG